MQLASWRRHSVDDDALIHILFYSVPGMILSPKLKTKRSFNMSLYSKTCVKRPLSKRLQIGFQDQLSLNAGQKVKGSILQYIRPSLSYHLSLRSMFCLFLSDRFTQVYTVHVNTFWSVKERIYSYPSLLI